MKNTSFPNREKLDITTNLGGRKLSSGSLTKHYVSLESLVVLIAEIYEEAISKGWETSALDPLNEKIRELDNKLIKEASTYI